MWGKITYSILQVINWLKDVVPMTFSFGMIVYSWMRDHMKQLRIKLIQTELEKKHYENKETVEKNNAGKSDSDIIDDIAGKGDGTGS